MKKFLILFIIPLLCFTSCGKANDTAAQPTGYLEDPILDDIPSITIDESVFSYIGLNYDELCAKFEEEGVLYEYADYYEYFFNSFSFRFRYPEVNESAENDEENAEETAPQEPTVFEFTAKLSDFIRMDENYRTKAEMDLILGEGVVSENYTYVRYIYDIYVIDIICDGENIYSDSPIVISRVTADS